MAPASNEEQFKFLISCIRYSNNGKVDFGEVAKECGIVTKGAAAKRYERMMRSHGIASNAATIKPTTSTSRPKTERRSSTTVSSFGAKKRKMIDEFEENASQSNIDDEKTIGRQLQNTNKDTSVKAEYRAKQSFKVEVGTGIQRNLNMEETVDLMRYYNASPAFCGSPTSGGETGYNESDHHGSSAGCVAVLEGDNGMFGVPANPQYHMGVAYSHPSGPIPISSVARVQSTSRVEG